MKYIDDKGKVVLLMWMIFLLNSALAAQIRPLSEIL